METRWRRLAAAVAFASILAAAASAESAFTERGGRLRFFCNTGYSIESCRAHLDALRRVLATVDVARLGAWTWVLVRSEDWRPILRRVRRDPDSPAFTILDTRTTFLEEALFVAVPARDHTLLEKWRMPLSALLEHAVAHELGHAVCHETDERRASAYARELIDSSVITCR